MFGPSLDFGFAAAIMVTYLIFLQFQIILVTQLALK